MGGKTEDREKKKKKKRGGPSPRYGTPTGTIVVCYSYSAEDEDWLLATLDLIALPCPAYLNHLELPQKDRNAHTLCTWVNAVSLIIIDKLRGIENSGGSA